MPHPMPPATAFDVRKFIDEQPVGRYQLMVATMCSLIVFVDGFDAQAMGYVAPRSVRRCRFHAACSGR